MKHTFVFIDKLIILVKYLPPNLKDKKDQAKARKAIILIKEYTEILKNLIQNHKAKQHLDLLHNTHIKEIEDWAEQVAVVFKKMDSLLAVLDEDTKRLAHVLENTPEKWSSTVADMALGMIMTGLHYEDHVLKRLRVLAIFEIHELEKIIAHKKHVAGLHFWQNLSSLSGEEQILQHEKYFAELLG